VGLSEVDGNYAHKRPKTFDKIILGNGRRGPSAPGYANGEY